MVTLFKRDSVCVNEIFVCNDLYRLNECPDRVCQCQRKTYEQTNVRDEGKCYAYAIEHDMKNALGFKAEVEGVYAYTAQ